MKQSKRKLRGASVDSLILTFMQFVTYATGMITTKIIATGLSLEDYGTYSSINIIISISASFTLLGLGDCLNYYYNNTQKCSSKQERIDYVNSIYLVQSMVGIFVGIILLLGRGFVANYFDNCAIQALLCIVCFKPWFENTIHLYQVLFVSTGKAKVIAVRNFLLAIIRICIVYISLHILSSLELVFILLVLTDIFQIIIFNRMYAKRNFVVNIFKGSFSKLKPILAYSLPMGVYFITNTLMREIDKLIIGKMASTKELAIYTNSSKQLPLNIFVTAFATVLVPYIMQYVSEKKNEDAVNLFKNYLKLGYMTIWMLSVAIIISTKQIIPFLYSDAYLPGAMIFVLYMIVGMVQFASMHLIIAASGNSKYLMYLSMAMLALNAVLNIILYYVFDKIGEGMIGPAVSTVIVTILYNVLVLNKSIKILNVSIGKLFNFRHIITYCIQLVVLAQLSWWVKEKLIAFGMNRFLAMILICVFYCLFMFMIHIKEYIQILKVINGFKLTRVAEN